MRLSLAEPGEASVAFTTQNSNAPVLSLPTSPASSLPASPTPASDHVGSEPATPTAATEAPTSAALAIAGPTPQLPAAALEAAAPEPAAPTPAADGSAPKTAAVPSAPENLLLADPLAEPTAAPTIAPAAAAASSSMAAEPTAAPAPATASPAIAPAAAAAALAEATAAPTIAPAAAAASSSMAAEPTAAPAPVRMPVEGTYVLAGNNQPGLCFKVGIPLAKGKEGAGFYSVAFANGGWCAFKPQDQWQPCPTDQQIDVAEVMMPQTGKKGKPEGFLRNARMESGWTLFNEYTVPPDALFKTAKDKEAMFSPSRLPSLAPGDTVNCKGKVWSGKGNEAADGVGLTVVVPVVCQWLRSLDGMRGQPRRFAIVALPDGELTWAELLTTDEGLIEHTDPPKRVPADEVSSLLKKLPALLSSRDASNVQSLLGRLVTTAGRRARRSLRSSEAAPAVATPTFSDAAKAIASADASLPGWWSDEKGLKNIHKLQKKLEECTVQQLRVMCQKLSLAIDVHQSADEKNELIVRLNEKKNEDEKGTRRRALQEKKKREREEADPQTPPQRPATAECEGEEGLYAKGVPFEEEERGREAERAAAEKATRAAEQKAADAEAAVAELRAEMEELKRKKPEREAREEREALVAKARERREREEERLEREARGRNVEAGSRRWGSRPAWGGGRSRSRSRSRSSSSSSSSSSSRSSSRSRSRSNRTPPPGGVGSSSASTPFSVQKARGVVADHRSSAVSRAESKIERYERKQHNKRRTRRSRDDRGTKREKKKRSKKHKKR